MVCLLMVRCGKLVALFPGSPSCNYCMTFELALTKNSECEFKGHAIIEAGRLGTRLVNWWFAQKFVLVKLINKNKFSSGTNVYIIIDLVHM